MGGLDGPAWKGRFLMRLPDDLRAVLASIQGKGRPRLVGGCVRDWLMGLEPNDFDVEVGGLDFETLHRLLAPFGATDVVGRSFGVIKLRLPSGDYDFSLPRRESKTGAGHRGFAVTPDPALTEAEAAARRDFTVNAIAYDPQTNTVIDPLAGRSDLEARVLRHTGPAFSEDPLRVLRAFQLAARFEFSLAPETADLCRSMIATFAELPVERIWGEWEKWATKSTKPGLGLAVLKESGWLVHFPELAALDGCPQEPEWHPEGDVFVHTQHCLNALASNPDWQAAAPAKRRQLTFAVLAHDFGKPATTAQLERRGVLRWTSLGHEAAGEAPTRAFLARIGAPSDLPDLVCPLVLNHHAHHHGRNGVFTDTQVRRLARRLHPATIDDICAVMIADSRGRPPLHSPDTLAYIERLRNRSRQLSLQHSSPQALILGRHLVKRGLKPGPAFRTILDAALEAQLDGVFTNEAGGEAWLQNHLRYRYPDLQ
jgi:tRNA nucleotidyltransferase (CCA-adding enzyme)